MLNNLQIFKNTEFGEIGILVSEGKELFPATECARMLGYADPYDAINRHTKGSVKHRVLTEGGAQRSGRDPWPGQGGCRGRQPGQEHVPGEHVSRDSDPDERHSGLLATDDAGHGVDGFTTRAFADDQSQRRASPGLDQRHPGHVQDRSGPNHLAPG